jgi:glycosyltransferase involved in cell wall biosynthesis
MNNQNERIAIVADWLIDFWWAELVFSHLLETFPEADIYTSVCFMDHPMLEWRRVYTSWLQKIPFLNRRHKLAGILRPWAFRSFNLSSYDIIISSSSAEAKNAGLSKRGKWAKHFCYCHTPIRYYWSHYEEYRNMMEFGILNPLARFVFDSLIGWLRKLDFEAVQKVDYFIANSENTQQRIKKYYKRESTVIYPGVDIEKILESTKWWHIINGETEGDKLFETDDKQWKRWAKANAPQGYFQCDDVTKGQFLSPSEPFVSFQLWKERNSFGTFSHESTEEENRKEYFISIGRCIPYKKFDLLVDAFNENGKNLVLITNTNNPLYKELKEKSKPNITWKLLISQDEKNNLLAWAKGFVFPPEEDFWLVPIESMTYGIPVIAYGKWWALETVVEWVTGIFFPEQTTVALNATIEKFETMEFDKNAIMNHAKEFDKTVFQRKIIDFISSTLQ